MHVLAIRSDVTQQLHTELAAARKEVVKLTSRLSRREADLAAVEKEIARQVGGGSSEKFCALHQVTACV
jgi:septal ring factor EnvC (AmiA/AmiB activator)